MMRWLLIYVGSTRNVGAETRFQRSTPLVDDAHRSSRSGFLLPVKVLSRVFRGKFVAGVRHLFARDKLRFFGECVPLHNETRLAAFLRTLYQQDWVVYAKPPFGAPEHVWQYLALRRFNK